MIDLDVATPEEVPKVLREAVEKFYDSVGELESAWQDKKAGKVWGKIAAILDTTADKIEKIIEK